MNGRVCFLGLLGRVAFVFEFGIGCLGIFFMIAVKAEVFVCVFSF